MNKKLLAFAIGLVITSFLFAGFLFPKLVKGGGCTIDVFWRWKDGKDYKIPPTTGLNTPKTGDTVKVVAQYRNCNINNGQNSAYFLLFSPGTAAQKATLGAITTDFAEHWAPFPFYRPGDNYFKAVVEGAKNEIYVQESSHVQVLGKEAEFCKIDLNFDANPKTVNSVDQAITLGGKVSQTLKNTCASVNIDLEFYHGSGKLIEKKKISLSGVQSKEEAVSTTAGKLGYKTGDNINFYAKAVGTGVELIVVYGAGQVPRTQKIDVTSSVVPVGVERPPEAVEKYKCENDTCVKDPNGPYNGLPVCQAVCKPAAPPPGAPGAPGAPVTTKYVFNLKNPIAAENFQDLVNIIGKWIFNLAIPVAVIIIIYAGVLMLTAGGVPARFQKGAKALWYAVIGLAIVLIGKGFVTLIQSILNLRNR
jgi:hypothetical protein